MRTLVHLGCGPICTQTRWQDFDGSWNARLNMLPRFVRGPIGGTARALLNHRAVYPNHVRYLDLASPFPFSSNSVDAIYASHVWEHLYFNVAQSATAECFRSLKKTGILRLVVPDLRFYCETYVRSADPDAARNFNRQCLFREECREPKLLRRMYNALTDFHSHKFMYDASQLMKLLSEAGFTAVKQMKFRESGVPEISDVEQSGRVGYGIGIAIEAIKP